MSKKRKHVCIIGSGLTGATLAYLHQQAGDKVLVYEKRDHVGGNIFTEKVNDIYVHKYGAHIFHTSDKKVWDFVNKFVTFNNYTHIVKSKFNEKLYSLPINMNTFKEFFNIENPSEVTGEHIDYIKKCLYFGYSAKQWNVPVEKINEKVFERLPIRTNYNNNYFDDTYQGIPVKGYTPLILALLKDIPIIFGDKITILDRDYIKSFDIVYNTGPIDEFLSYELGHLEYRSLEFVTKTYKDKTYQDYAVINEANEEVPYTRTIEHKHFNFTGQKDTVVTFEFPQDYNGTNEPYYTVNTKVNERLYGKYKELAAIKFPNMVFCGRLGSYKYYDMDDAIKEAFIIFNEYNFPLL